MSKQKMKMDWGSLPQDNSLGELDKSTEAILLHATSPQEKSTDNSVSSILRAYSTETVRIRISKSVYNRILEAKKINNSRLSVPAFVELAIDKLLKDENL